MATKLQIWNRALYHVGGRGRLQTLTDDVEARYVFDTIWPFVLEDALSRGDWHFATKTHHSRSKHNSHTNSRLFLHVQQAYRLDANAFICA